ncbi:hypothetical protein J42TS3_06620 [Paenibacillus vini]|uniref:Uncharacterized protein n=1 Tax=Paenibacillus vini TaxID=1476024 RepID=A0ABQ4M7L3_9BACL|nr:hypothetical protein J42TS3_06620 [Paenibacillus vini]
MNQVDIKAKKKRDNELLILNLQQDQENARLNIAESKRTNTELLG